MRKQIAFLILITFSIQTSFNPFSLSDANPRASFATNLSTDQNKNNFQISFDSDSLLENKSLFIILESTNPDFSLSVSIGENTVSRRQPSKMDVSSKTGNIVLIITDDFFQDKFDEFKRTGKLSFAVNNFSEDNLDYKIKVEVGRILPCEIDRSYTITTTEVKQDIKIDIVFDGSIRTDAQKLRFQVSTVKRKSGYQLGASLEHKKRQYMLNPIFDHMVGGVIKEPTLPICKTSSCKYTLSISIENVEVFNIESFSSADIEKISIHHYEDYYDRVYENDTIVKYELPYESLMEEMDVSITLTHVSGVTGLFVNPLIVPLNLSGYNWKEEGPLAKRITIKWTELQQMKAEGKSLFIAVHCEKPGEFMIRADAHDPGLRGRLSPGILEAGFVDKNEFVNYLFYFEIFQTQDISFDLELVVSSGEADLFVKQCESYRDCKIGEAEIGDTNILSVENNHSRKKISHSFNCKARGKTSTLCEFVVGVKGKEEHGTHYDISLQEGSNHRLLVPNNPLHIDLGPLETRHLKFSYPKEHQTADLFLSVEPFWGNFNVFISRKEQHPNDENNNLALSFQTTKAQLLDAVKTTKITSKLMNDFTTQGVYYLTISSLTSCSLNLRFFETNDNAPTIHTLSAGSFVQGEVLSADGIAYYTIRISLKKQKTGRVSINLVPIKGDYNIIANKNGKLPTLDNYDYLSDSNYLDIENSELGDSGNFNGEFIIGVQLRTKFKKGDKRYRFVISFNYSDKPVLLRPGVLVTQTLQQNNYFLIEVTKNMSNLLVLRSIVDGYNMNVCANFASSERIEGSSHCQHTANEKTVGIFIEEKEINSNCEENWSKGKCFLQLVVKGSKDQKFTMGYTYNDHPFVLVKDTVIHGPIVTKGNYMINFIYHAEENSPVSFYFNSKGRRLDIFTRIVKQEEFEGKMTVSYPNKNTYDKDNQKNIGYITNVFYDEAVVSNIGKSPEVLISIRTKKTEEGEKPFDLNNHFVLQSSLQGREILRTQTHVEHIYKENWNYYVLYNNGISNNLRVYVYTESTAPLEVNISRNRQSRAPMTNKALVSKKALSSVDIEVTSRDLNKNSNNAKNKDSLKGYFTIGVKSAIDCVISVYWNNKTDLNYIELTPNEPSSMGLSGDRKLYFNTYVKDSNSKLSQDRGSVVFYFKASVKTNIYILKSLDGELTAPSEGRNNWKTTIGDAGGVSMLKIDSDDPDYCIDCNYIGFISSKDRGQITVLVDIEHEKIPIYLLPGFDFPNFLPGHGEKVFRFFNPDEKSIAISVSLLSGFVNLYISDSPKISINNYKDHVFMEINKDTHKFITVNPTRFGIEDGHDFFILVENPKLDASSFVLTIVKNEVKSPIGVGVKKQVTLAPAESVEFSHKPRKKDKSFSVILEIKQILDQRYTEEVLSQLDKFMTVHLLEGKKSSHRLKLKSTSMDYNRMMVDFDIRENEKGTFAIKISNIVSSAITMNVELGNNGYRLVNLNNSSVDIIKDKDEIIYEAYGLQDKYLFVDFRTCIGELEVSIFQTDYPGTPKAEKQEYKTIKDSNSEIHYIKLKKQKAFIKVKNNQTDLSIFEFSAFNEVDLDKNPFSEVVQGEGGKIRVLTENNSISFQPVKLQVGYQSGFVHRVEYKLFLSTTYRAMKFVKNCNLYLLEKALPDSIVKEFTVISLFDTEESLKAKDGRVHLSYKGLEKGVKYFGVVVGSVHLLPKDGGYVSPVRSAKVYYDEFVIITPKLYLPLNLLIGFFISFGLLTCFFFIIRAYIFGDIGKFKDIDGLKGFQELDGSIGGPQVTSILEQEYLETVQEPVKVEEETKEEDIEYDEEIHGDIELTDHTDRERPLA